MEREVKSPEEMEIDKLIAEIVNLHELEDSDKCAKLAHAFKGRSILNLTGVFHKYSRKARMIAKLAHAIEGRRILNLNGVFHKYSRKARTSALAMVFTLLESSNSSVESLLLQNNQIDPETLASALFSSESGGGHWKVLKVKTIDLADNMIRSYNSPDAAGRFNFIVKAMKAGSLASLASLSLSRTGMNSDDMIDLANALQYVPNLHTLRLEGNMIDAKGVEALAAYLGNVRDPVLQEFRLSTKGVLEPFGFDALALAFKTGNFTSLKVLYLEGSSTSRDLHRALVEAMNAGSLPSLRELLLPACNVDSDSCKAYAQALISRHLPALQVLDLSRNDLIEREAIKFLAEAINSGGGHSFKEVNLSTTKMGDLGVRALLIAPSMGAGITQLTRMVLSDAELLTEGLLSIASAVSWGNLKALEVLDVSDNIAKGKQGVRELAASFECGQLPRLRELRLGFTGVEDEGLVSIARAVSWGHLKSLEVLDLSRNSSIGNQGVLALAESFQFGQLTRLGELLLGNTSAGDEGLLGIAKSFLSGHVQSLEKVDLRGTLCHGHVREIDPDKEGQLSFFNSKVLLSDDLNVVQGEEGQSMLIESSESPKVLDTLFDRGGQPRQDIQLIGFESFQDKFDPQQILCLFNSRMVSYDILELVFFHNEGMATVCGVGVPFSRVLIRPVLSKIVVKEMSEDHWRSLWIDPRYKKSFKPLIFEKSGDKVAVGVKSGHHHSIKQGPKDESVSYPMIKFRTGFMNWFDQLLSDLKVVEISGKKNVVQEQVGSDQLLSDLKVVEISGKKNVVQGQVGSDGGDPTHGPGIDKLSLRHDVKDVTNYEASTSTSSSGVHSGVPGLIGRSETTSTTQGTQGVIAIRDKVNEEDKKLSWVVDVEMNESDCELKELVIEDKENNDHVLSNCFIKPSLRIEFFCNISAHDTVKKGSEHMNVTMEAEYQLDGNIEDARKFGWYQNDLRLSFDCISAVNNQSPVAILKGSVIKSPVKNSDVFYTDHSGRSQSSSRGSTRAAGAKGGFLGCAAGFSGVNKNEITEGTDDFSQNQRQGSTVCLKDAEEFSISRKSTQNKLVYEASLRKHIGRSSMWNEQDRISFKASGMFSNVHIAVEGCWRLSGNEFHTHQFVAERVLKQVSKVEEAVPGKKTFWKKVSSKMHLSKERTLRSRKEPLEQTSVVRQIIRKVVQLNHSFSHSPLNELGEPKHYSWLLREQTPLPKFIKEE